MREIVLIQGKLFNIARKKSEENIDEKFQNLLELKAA